MLRRKNIINFFYILKNSKKIKKKFNNKNKNSKIDLSFKKIKVIGNFFKLKFINKKKIIKFSLCLAHKIYLLNKNQNKNCSLKKIKKNKILFIQQNKKINKYFLKNILTLKNLKKKRKLNSYTKKGIKFNNDIFSFKVGKKTTY